MHGNRIGDAWHKRTDAAEDARAHAAAFVVCPVGLMAPWQQSLYRAAFEQAAARLRRATLEIVRHVVWN